MRIRPIIRVVVDRGDHRRPLPARPDRPDSRSVLRGPLKDFSGRALGPYRAGSWVTSFAVPAGPSREHLYTLYVGTRNGGVWKTVNNGTTFEPVFDAQPKLSIGDVAVAPSDPERRLGRDGRGLLRPHARTPATASGSPTDAGKTWTNMGLPRFAPHRPDRHPSRRIPTSSTSRSWATSSRRTPSAASSRRPTAGRPGRRSSTSTTRSGPSTSSWSNRRPTRSTRRCTTRSACPGITSSADRRARSTRRPTAGKTWTRLGGGLPTGRIGRIGLDVYQKNPNILYAVVENGNRAAADGPGGRAGQAPRRRAGPAHGRQRGLPHGRRRQDLAQGQRRLRSRPQQGALFLQPAPPRPERSRDRLHHRPVAGLDERRRQDLEGPRAGRPTGSCPGPSATGGCMWVDPLDSNRLIFGSDGGVNISYDRGKTSHHAYNLPLTEFYAVGVDMEDPYNIYGGLQDHDSWKGPSNGWAGEITLDRLGDGRRRRRHVQLRRSDRQPLGLQQPRDGDDVALRPEDGRPDADHAPAAGRASRACASTGRRRSPSRRTTRPSSTPGPRSSSGRSTAATTGRRSAPT